MKMYMNKTMPIHIDNILIYHRHIQWYNNILYIILEKIYIFKVDTNWNCCISVLGKNIQYYIKYFFI